MITLQDWLADDAVSHGRISRRPVRIVRRRPTASQDEFLKIAITNSYFRRVSDDGSGENMCQEMVYDAIINTIFYEFND